MKRKRTLLLFLFLCFCGYMRLFAQAENHKNEFIRPLSIPYPPNNPYSKEKEQLGKKLFFDPRLSGSNIVSCATCHSPSFSWSDGLPKGVGHGHKKLSRRSPTLLNLAWAERLFWDGRAGSLEEQALGPLFSETEMHGKKQDSEKEIFAVSEYKTLFEKAFPHESLTNDLIIKAITTYERSIVSGTAPFDKYISGDEKALSPSALNGFKLFTGKAKCINCHSGWNFTDGSFHDIGLKTKDKGRGKILPLPTMLYAFKTPTLRNIADRSPYMHDGSESTLESVIDFYNQGGKIKRLNTSPEIKPLNLTSQEKTELLDFLKSLSSVDPIVELPLLPH